MEMKETGWSASCQQGKAHKQHLASATKQMLCKSLNCLFASWQYLQGCGDNIGDARVRE